jgi:ribosomal protein S10
LIDIHEPTSKTIDTLTKLNVPAGVFIKMET